MRIFSAQACVISLPPGLRYGKLGRAHQGRYGLLRTPERTRPNSSEENYNQSPTPEHPKRLRSSQPFSSFPPPHTWRARMAYAHSMPYSPATAPSGSYLPHIVLTVRQKINEVQTVKRMGSFFRFAGTGPESLPTDLFPVWPGKP